MTIYIFSLKVLCGTENAFAHILAIYQLGYHCRVVHEKKNGLISFFCLSVMMDELYELVYAIMQSPVLCFLVYWILLIIWKQLTGQWYFRQFVL